MTVFVHSRLIGVFGHLKPALELSSARAALIE